MIKEDNIVPVSDDVGRRVSGHAFKTEQWGGRVGALEDGATEGGDWVGDACGDDGTGAEEETAVGTKL